MHAIDTEEHLSETPPEQNVETGADNITKRVPITESIRYRRRAQSAEKHAQDLSEQLDQAHQEIGHLSEDLKALRRDQALAQKLGTAGATDLEAAVLIARARLEHQTDLDIDACVEQLKHEKRYLFGGAPQAVTSRKTAGVKDRLTHGQTTLERAARKAARTRQRTDLQEYLQLRRHLM